MPKSLEKQSFIEDKRTKKVISNLARALSYELIHDYNMKSRSEPASVLKGIESILDKHFIFLDDDLENNQEESKYLNQNNKEITKKIGKTRLRRTADVRKSFFGKYTPTKYATNIDHFDSKQEEKILNYFKTKFSICFDKENMDTCNPKVHYNLIDDVEKSTILLGNMLKMKKNMFLSVRTDCD